MANLGNDELTVTEKVTRLIGLPTDDFKLAIAKVKDPNVLREAAIKAFMKDRNEVLKDIVAQATSLGITLDY
jgi:hypothetical protein